LLAAQSQRDARGDETFHARRRFEDVSDEERRADGFIEVIYHEQQSALSEKVQQLLARVAGGEQRELHGGGDLRVLPFLLLPLLSPIAIGAIFLA
jgi:hypothetical protein